MLKQTVRFQNMDIDDRPLEWNSQTMKECANKWTLADDVALLKYLENISKNIIEKANCTLKSINNFETSLNEIFIDVRTASNRFQSLADTQFVENRVYEEEEISNDKTCEVGDVEVQQDNADNTIYEAILQCLHTVDSKFETFELSGSDSDDDTLDKLILKPKDRYKDRLLPHLIGSEEFMNDSTLGLFDASSNNTESGDDSDDSILSSGSSSSFKVSNDDVKVPQFLAKNVSVMQDSISVNLNENGGPEERDDIINKEANSKLNSEIKFMTKKRELPEFSDEEIFEAPVKSNMSQSSLFQSDEDESDATSVSNEKTSKSGNELFGNFVDLFVNETMKKDEVVKENDNSGDRLKGKLNSKEVENSTFKKIPKSGVSIFGKDVNIFGENPPALPKNKLNEKKVDTKESKSAKQDNIHSSKKKDVSGQMPTDIAQHNIWEEPLLFDNQMNNDLFSVSSTNTDTPNSVQKKDVFANSNKKEIKNDSLSFSSNKKPFVKPEDTLFGSDSDLFSEVDLPPVLYSGLNLFSEEDDDIFFSEKIKTDRNNQTEKNHFSKKHLFESDMFSDINEEPREVEKGKRSSSKEIGAEIKEKSIVESLPGNSFKNEKIKANIRPDLVAPIDNPVETNTDKSESYTFDKEFSGKATEIGVSSLFNDFQSERKVEDLHDIHKTEVSSTYKSPSRKYSSEMKVSGKTSPEKSQYTHFHPRDIANQKVWQNYPDKIQDDGLPPLSSNTLHNLVKGRAKIKSKRRPPSKKTKDISSSSEKENTNTVLSPSTDEEDIFQVPSLDLPKDKSLNNLFSGDNLLSPGISIDSPMDNLINRPNDNASSNHIHIKPQELNSEEFDDDTLFNTNPLNKSRQVTSVESSSEIDDDLFACEKVTFPLEKPKKFENENIKNKLFESDDEDDIFSTVPVSRDSLFELEKNSNSNILNISSTISGNQSTFSSKNTHSSLFQDSSDEDELFPSILKSSEIENEDKVPKKHHFQNPSKITKGVVKLETKEVFVDPLMALQGPHITEQ